MNKKGICEQKGHFLFIAKSWGGHVPPVPPGSYVSDYTPYYWLLGCDEMSWFEPTGLYRAELQRHLVTASVILDFSSRPPICTIA